MKEYAPPGHAELLARFIDAADSGNWNRCRVICNTAGCGPGKPAARGAGYSWDERQVWRALYELACSLARDREWPNLRAELVPPVDPPDG